MKKIMAVMVSAVLLVCLLVGCNTNQKTDGDVPATPVTVRVTAIQGPTGVGMVHLMDASANKQTENTYSFSVETDPSLAAAKLKNGSVDIAALPTNAAANLYNKSNGQIQLLAVNTLGVLYMLENGNSIQSIADLRGKTIYSTGQGANPEYVLKYILQQNGIDPNNDVTITFVNEPAELITAMKNDQTSVAMVPQPAATQVLMNVSGSRIALSMNDEWEKVAGTENKLMMGCVAVRTAFLQEHPEAVKTFLKEYKAAIEKTQNIDATATLCETYGIIPKAALAKKAIPYCAVTYVDGSAMKAQISKYFTVLLEANPQSIGGKLPNDNFYYMG